MKICRVIVQEKIFSIYMKGEKRKVWFNKYHSDEEKLQPEWCTASQLHFILTALRGHWGLLFRLNQMLCNKLYLIFPCRFMFPPKISWPFPDTQRWSIPCFALKPVCMEGTVAYEMSISSPQTPPLQDLWWSESSSEGNGERSGEEKKQEETLTERKSSNNHKHPIVIP